CARADKERSRSAHLERTPSPEAGDTERRGQSPRLVDPGDPGQSGAGCAQAHPRTCVRGGLPTGVVWISAQATAHDAIKRVAEAIAQRKTRVLDFDLRAYFDNVRHDRL